MTFVAPEARSEQIPAMVARLDPESDEAVALRATAIRVVYKRDMNQAQFAGWLGVGYQRWNNVENGGPLSKDLAMTLVRKIPTLTLDYVLRGVIDRGMNPELAQRLSEAAENAKTG